jgi:hypothetical protein
MSGIKLKSVPIFPSRVVGGLAIDVEKASGNYTVSVDYANLALVNPYVAQPTDYVLTWDSLADDYFLVPATSLSGSTVSPSPSPSTTTTWTPLNLGAAVVACYDFSTSANVTVSGGVLTFVADLTNNQYNLVNGGSPTYNATGINGFGAASFDGTAGQCLTNSAMLLNQAQTDQAFTVVCLFKTGSVITNSEEIWGGDSNAVAQRAIFFANLFTGHPTLYAGVASVDTSKTLNTNSIYLSTVVMKGGASQYSFDAVPLTQISATPGPIGIVNGFRLSGDGPLNGLIGYCVVIDGELTTSDLQKLQGYIAVKFGLTTTNLPTTHPYYGATTGPQLSDPYEAVEIANLQIKSFPIAVGTPGSYSNNGDNTFGFHATSAGCLQQTLYFPYTGEYTFNVPSYYIGSNLVATFGNALGVCVDQIPLEAVNPVGTLNYFTHFIANAAPAQSYVFRGFVTCGFHSVLIRLNYNAYGGQPSSNFHSERIIIQTTNNSIPAEPAGSRDPTQYPSSSNFIWNLPIGSGAIWSAATDADTITITTTASNRVLNTGSFSVPVYIGQNTDSAGSWEDNDSSQTPDVSYPGIKRNLTHVPAGMTVSPDGVDKTIVVIDGANHRYTYAGFSGTVAGNNVVVGRGRWQDMLDLNPGMGQDMTQYWGLLRIQELLNNSFQHQLIFALATQFVLAGSTTNSGLAWPASESDFNGPFGQYTGNVLYGSKIGIPAGTAMPAGLSATGRAFWTCMVNYGAVMNITGGEPSNQITFYAEIGCNAAAPTQVANLQTDLNTILPYCRILRNNTPATHNGGGTPIVPLLPGLVRPLLKNAWVSSLNPNDSNQTVSNGGYTATQSLVNTDSITRSTPQIGWRQIYMEFIINVKVGTLGVGVASPLESLSVSGGIGASAFSMGFYSSKSVFYNNVNIGSFSATNLGVGDTFCLAIDGINNKIWARKNNGNWNNDVIANQNPASNVGGFDQFSPLNVTLPAVYGFTNGDQISLVQPASQAFTAPAGFVPT